MRSRLHFKVLDQNTNLFKLAGIDKTPAEAARESTNPYVEDYSSICLTAGHETQQTFFEASFDQRFERSSSGAWLFGFRVPHTVVCRGNVTCCCATCFHCGTAGFAQSTNTPKKTGHMGSEYVESCADLSTLHPLARLCATKVGDKSYGAELASAAQSLGLSAADLQAHIPYLTSPTSVADVFAGTAKASDIFYTAAALHLLLHPERGILKAVHKKMSMDWSQRNVSGDQVTSVEIPQ